MRFCRDIGQYCPCLLIMLLLGDGWSERVQDEHVARDPEPADHGLTVGEFVDFWSSRLFDGIHSKQTRRTPVDMCGLFVDDLRFHLYQSRAACLRLHLSHLSRCFMSRRDDILTIS